ncbi:MAG: PsiF family protein [Pseudomonadota bacterium]
MKMIALAATLAFLVTATPLWAADSAAPAPVVKTAPVPVKSAPAAPAVEPAQKPLTKQQQKMKDCNGEAKIKAMKGQERKDFMKKCLSAG